MAQQPAKRTRAPEQTRRRILEAAKAEFSAMGLEGARTATIARRSGVNPQGIFHHFTSKEGLYAAVVASLFEVNWFAQSRDRLLALDPREALVEMMDFMMDRARNDPAFIAILLDANLHGACHLRAAPIAAYHAEVLRTIGAVLARGQAAGLFQPVDPAFLYLTVMGAVGSPTHAGPMFSALLDKYYANPRELERWYEAFKALVLRGISRSPA